MPSWRPDCLRAPAGRFESLEYRRSGEGASADANSRQEIDEERRGIAVVELLKQEGCGLGLTISGGTDKGQRSHISSIRAGGIAHRSDALQVGDNIISVNGIRTASLKHEEIVNLLKNAGDRVVLEVEYELPDSGDQAFSVQCKHQEIVLVKEGKGFGFTLRGGLSPDGSKSHPLIVTHIRPGSPADRENSLKEGDRILAVNGYHVTHLSLSEAMVLLNQCGREATFLFEYDVSVMSAVQNATGPLLVEIDKTPGSSLGIDLSQSSYQNRRCVCVDRIKPASVADRCGALHVGDHILSIDGATVEHMSVAEASQLLRSSLEEQIKLEILPIYHIQQKTHRDTMMRKALVPVLPSSASSPMLSSISPPVSSAYQNYNTLTTCQGYNTISSTGTIGRMSTARRKTWGKPERINHPSIGTLSIASTGSMVTNTNQICHSETTEVILYPDTRGLGVSLEGGVFSTAVLTEPPIIAHIEPKSVAERCGLIQEGDRILSVNGQELVERTLEEVNQLLRDAKPYCVLEIEFDVTESVLASSGTFIVKLAKRIGGLGLTVSAPSKKSSKKESLIITDIKKGSVAHRCGSIHPGDRILAINDVRMDTCSSDEASQLLQGTDDIIKLKLKKDDSLNEGGDDVSTVTYTVELQKQGGPLGITISGTEEPFDPITISGLTQGGLAEKTGAIHIGDTLLAINGQGMRGRTLSEAIKMLQMAGDIVTLKISRCLAKTNSSKGNTSLERDEGVKSTTPNPSVDSAMESWDSSGLDNTGTNTSGSKRGCKSLVPVRPPRPISQDSKSSKSAYTRDSTHSSMCDAEGSGEVLAERNLSDEDWDTRSNSSNSYGSSVEPDDWTQTLQDFEKGGQSEMLKQIGMSLRQRSVSSLARSRSGESGKKTRVKKKAHDRGYYADSDEEYQNFLSRHRLPKTSSGKNRANSAKTPATFQDHVQNIFAPTPIQLHRISLVKEKATEDFGFGLSDGMYEKGVYISAIKPASLAHKKGLKAYDRLLQVNNKRIRDLDCRMAVPLIAEAGNHLELVVSRNPIAAKSRNSDGISSPAQQSSACEYSSWDDEICYENVNGRAMSDLSFQTV
ncbi:glutamate receptor-interacting protein 1-like isoform X3 [Liolophura sinensis]|uniref:glutamate receptor-interacting protein 1-like isoform X3 n=1 Tax=Liolophura sinensis TaxID=3198878 RepID=UPI0031594F7D